MNCIICRQAQTAGGFTSVTLEHGEFRIQINQVPAQICPECGEAIVAEAVAINLIRLAKHSSDQGIREDVCDYDSLESMV
jgi:YgiT-type zinc finger domain-containing protein